MSIKFALYCAEIAADILADLPERDLVCELMQRDDTRALIVTEAEKLLGYAVFGSDDDGILTVYAARAISGLMARAAMVGMFGAAQIMGAPLRVHTERVAAMARMMGAGSFASAFDSDGIPMGVFGGV